MIVYQTWLQRHVPDAMRGRVFTWLDVVWNVVKVISLGLGGWLAEQDSVEVVYYIGGILLMISGLVGIFMMRGKRQAAEN